MMNLYIETENGQIKNHPAFEDNLIAAFGSVPEHWVPFERIERPRLGAYEVWTAEEPTYGLVDGVYKDVWHKRNMTTEEKTAKQQAVKDGWALLKLDSWVFNEETCDFEAPFPKPDDGNNYKWDETTISWVVFEKVAQESVPVVEVATPTITETVTPVVEQFIVTSDNSADSISGADSIGGGGGV